MKKAQMSLEMIIGLLILLVVAVVVIRMFLNNSKTIDEPWKSVKTSLKWEQFVSECQGYCNNFKISGSKATLAKYCYTKLLGDTDLNRNGKSDALPSDTKILEVCEDGVYCFHAYECKTETGNIDWDDCRQIVCQAYYDVYKDWAKADEKVYELFPNEGTCEIDDDENWWKMYFGSNPCTDPGKPPSEIFSLSLGACTIQSSDWSFNCAINSMTGECKNGWTLVANSGSTNVNLWAIHGIDTVGLINYGTDTLSGNFVRIDGSVDPQVDIDCNFLYQCDINEDDDITGDDFSARPSSCQIV